MYYVCISPLTLYEVFVQYNIPIKTRKYNWLHSLWAGRVLLPSPPSLIEMLASTGVSDMLPNEGEKMVERHITWGKYILAFTLQVLVVSHDGNF